MSAPAGFDYAAFEATADRIAGDFISNTEELTLLPFSILFSDALCLCALCEMYGVDYLLESGTGFGGSTEMLARYFHGRKPRIVSVDLTVTRWQRWLHRRLGTRDKQIWCVAQGGPQQVRARLASYPQVELLSGDGVRVLPQLVRKLTATGSRVGVLIDGPKEAAQLQLAQSLLAGSPLVCFAALHDIAPRFNEGARHARFLGSRYAAFATSDRRFFDRYHSVNAGRLPARFEDTGDGLGVLINSA